MELFITQANIERYQRLLLVEADPRRVAVLRTLLGAEVEKLARIHAAGAAATDPGPLSALR